MASDAELDAAGKHGGNRVGEHEDTHEDRLVPFEEALESVEGVIEEIESPIFGDLSGLPPLLIQVGSNEILLSDALRLAARAALDDVQVTLEVTPGVPHVFQGFAGLLDEAGAALDRAADFLNTQFAHAPTHV